MSNTTPEGPGNLATPVNDTPASHDKPTLTLFFSMTDSFLHKPKLVSGFLRFAMRLNCEFKRGFFLVIDKLTFLILQGNYQNPPTIS